MTKWQNISVLKLYSSSISDVHYWTVLNLQYEDAQ
jgi:hypothetical protein